MEDVKALSIMNVAKRRRSRHRGTSPSSAAASGQTNHPQVLVDDAETCRRDSYEGPGGATRPPLLDINRRPSDSTSANSETQNCKCRISIHGSAVLAILIKGKKSNLLITSVKLIFQDT